MRWPIWKKAQQKCLGLDINVDSIRLVYLILEAGQTTYSQTLELAVPTTTKENSVDVIAQTIKQLVYKANTNCRSVVTAFKDTHCLIQLTQLYQSSSDWRISALLNSASSIPLPLDTLYFDFKKLKDTDNYQEILGVFCRKSLVKDRIKLIKASELKLIALEVESHAFERSFGYLHVLPNYPACWACVLINPSKLIILLWSHQIVLGSFSEDLKVSETLTCITTKVYQYLMQLLGKYTIHPLETLWVVGDHPLCEHIEIKVHSILGLTEHPKLLIHQSMLRAKKINWNSFYVAFGLALYSLP